MAPRLDRLLKEFPDELALIYRHWPLAYHPHAYDAAVAAECSGDQGHFGPMHLALYSETGWTDDPPESIIELAVSIGIPDPVQFRSCLTDEEPHPRVEADIAAVEQLGGRGTPTIIVEGVRFGTLPDSAKLDEHVRTALARARKAP